MTPTVANVYGKLEGACAFARHGKLGEQAGTIVSLERLEVETSLLETETGRDAQGEVVGEVGMHVGVTVMD
jgi:hypothetical protein